MGGLWEDTPYDAGTLEVIGRTTMIGRPMGGHRVYVFFVDMKTKVGMGGIREVQGR